LLLIIPFSLFASFATESIAYSNGIRGSQERFAGTPSPSTAVRQEFPTRLKRGSPLATDDQTIFAVAADGHTIVARPLESSRPWTSLAGDVVFGQIAGLAYGNGYLYVSDEESASVYRIRLDTHERSLLHQGSPLRTPAEIVVVGDAVCVADSDGSLYLLPGVGGEPSSLSLGAHALKPGRIFLANSKNDLLIAQPESGSLIQLSLGPIMKLKKTQGLDVWGFHIEPMDLPTMTNDVRQFTKIDILRDQTRKTAFLHPSSLGIQDGIVYSIDEVSGQIYAFSRHDLRPARIVFPNRSTYKSSRILVTRNKMIVLNEPTGDIAIEPIQVPAEISVDVQTSESLSALYGYLYDKGILPTTRVTLHKSIENTLRENRVLLSPYVESLTRIICGLNRSICANQKFQNVLPEEIQINVPDLFSESYIDARPITLDGVQSLGEVVDKRVKSNELSVWKEDEELRGMNPQFKGDASDGLRAVKNGKFIAPIELVRYVAALPASDLNNEKSELSKILNEHKTLSVISLQEVAANPQQSSLEIGALTKAGRDGFRDAWVKLLSTIHYYHPPNVMMTQTPFVGVAEKDIDCDNPDFDGNVCLSISDEIHSIPTAAVLPPPVDHYTFRDFDIADHGTAVAALLAAHHTEFSGKGLASPETVVIPLHDTDPSIGEDIRRAYTSANARIFNLSLTFPKGVIPKNLGKYMNQDSQYAYGDALFVVAADDDGMAVCGTTFEYPLCWGAQPNVLVVAATAIDGTALIQNVGGSNWGSKYVQLAAPGSGFGASGRNKAYVPLIGTSFAAPLVTATAALLFAEGITEPRLIKQRLISTSEPVANFGGKIQGGLLNVKRAVSHPHRASLISDDDKEQIVQMLPGNIAITWADGNMTLPLNKILRLTRNPGGDFRIVFIDSVGTRDLRILDNVSFDEKLPWKIRYDVLNDDNSVKSSNVEGSLTNYKDYIGPVQ
jgi:hypothetical protein